MERHIPQSIRIVVNNTVQTIDTEHTFSIDVTVNDPLIASPSSAAELLDQLTDHALDEMTSYIGAALLQPEESTTHNI